MKLKTLLLITLTALMSLPAFAYNLDGSLTSSYEVSKDKGEDNEGLWDNYLRLDDAAIYSPYLTFSMYGRFAYDESKGYSYSDLYSGYLDYSTFQKALEVQVGRFSYVSNKFLTLDGAMATLKTDYYVGATVFGGSPQYFDEDDRHINETFRNTGNRLYGGKLFLNGVKDTTGYVSYSRETDDSELLQELYGLGLGHSFSYGKDLTASVDGKMEYDTQTDDIYRGTARAYIKYQKLTVVGDATRYNVTDGTDFNQELIISNFSTGKEEKYGLNVYYAVTDNIKPYIGLVRTKMELNSGGIVSGEIYRAGTDLDWFKTAGVTANIEGYYYNSYVSNAKGGSANINWDVTRQFRLALESEMLRLDNTTTNETVSSVYLKGEYDLTKDLTVSLYGEANKDTTYLPEHRIGVKAAYSF